MAKNSFDEIFLGFCLTLFQKGPIFSVVWTARGNKLQKYFLFAENQDFPLNNSTWLWKVLAKFYYYSMEIKFMDSVCFKRKLAWISLQSGFSLMRVNEILKLAWISIQSGSFLDASKWKTVSQRDLFQDESIWRKLRCIYSDCTDVRTKTLKKGLTSQNNCKFLPCEMKRSIKRCLFFMNNLKWNLCDVFIHIIPGT